MGIGQELLHKQCQGQREITLTFYRCEIVKAAAIRAGVEVYERVRERGPRAGEKETRSRVSPPWLRHASASHSIDRGAQLPLVRDTLG